MQECCFLLLSPPSPTPPHTHTHTHTHTYIHTHTYKLSKEITDEVDFVAKAAALSMTLNATLLSSGSEEALNEQWRGGSKEKTILYYYLPLPVSNSKFGMINLISFFLFMILSVSFCLSVSLSLFILACVYTVLVGYARFSQAENSLDLMPLSTCVVCHCIYKCTYIHTYIQPYIHTHIHTYIHHSMCIYLYVWLYTCMNIYPYISKCLF